MFRITKKYNLGSKSDMRRFMRDFEKDIKTGIRKDLLKETFDINCPNCNRNIKVRKGRNVCPYCREEINFNLDVKF